MTPTTTPRHSVSVAGAVIDEHGRFLVIRRRDNGHWELPGGVLELDEPIYAGIGREVREETGLIVPPERITGLYKNLSRAIVAIVVRAHVTGGRELTSDETSDVGWWTPEEIRNGMVEAFAVRLLDALGDGPPAVRVHDGTRVLPEQDPLVSAQPRPQS